MLNDCKGDPGLRGEWLTVIFKPLSLFGREDSRFRQAMVSRHSGGLTCWWSGRQLQSSTCWRKWSVPSCRSRRRRNSSHWRFEVMSQYHCTPLRVPTPPVWFPNYRMSVAGLGRCRHARECGLEAQSLAPGYKNQACRLSAWPPWNVRCRSELFEPLR